MELFFLWCCSLNHWIRPHHFSARCTSTVFQHIDHFAFERYLNLKMISTDDILHTFVIAVSIIACCFTGGFLLKIALYLWKAERERARKRTHYISSAGALGGACGPQPNPHLPRALAQCLRAMRRMWLFSSAKSLRILWFFIFHLCLQGLLPSLHPPSLSIWRALFLFLVVI